MKVYTVGGIHDVNVQLVNSRPEALKSCMAL